jgi:DNA-binding MarR family transcriptional regulator/GNAT superfamily N-acetyltransferase
MNFFNQTGKMVLGSRLRRLSEQITENALQIYRLYDIDFQPKWFPVFYVLSKGQEKPITEIAEEIGHSQPSVSKIIAEMVKANLVIETKNKADGRKNMVSLSQKGIEITEKIEHQYTDVTNAIEDTFAQTTHDLWKAIEEWEYLLNQKNLLRRVEEQKKLRESKNVKIVAYQSKYQADFRALNIEWISSYFKMEESDFKALDDPEGYILKKGGYIFVALYNDEPVGVCALLKMENHEYEYELAKMAVSPKAQGKNIGWLLGQAIVEKAKSLGAKSIYLESNTILKPAINLYNKLGFQKVVGFPTPYERCNIQMALNLK